MSHATQMTQAQQELADMRADLAAASSHAELEALYWGFALECALPTDSEALILALVAHIDKFARDCGLPVETLGADLKVGDTILVLGRSHRITELRPHPAYARLVPGQNARIADCDTRLSITVDDKSSWQVVA